MNNTLIYSKKHALLVKNNFEMYYILKYCFKLNLNNENFVLDTGTLELKNNHSYYTAIYFNVQR